MEIKSPQKEIGKKNNKVSKNLIKDKDEKKIRLVMNLLRRQFQKKK